HFICHILLGSFLTKAYIDLKFPNVDRYQDSENPSVTSRDNDRNPLRLLLPFLRYLNRWRWLLHQLH
ncbi:hypothetical protein, partial [Cytobacillus firmus]|uniref:hypothetical protein n=1 Tax=Cytobacillus firmus TaxID=1399 RepID=UPI0039A7338B